MENVATDAFSTNIFIFKFFKTNRTTELKNFKWPFIF